MFNNSFWFKLCIDAVSCTCAATIVYPLCTSNVHTLLVKGNITMLQL